MNDLNKLLSNINIHCVKNEFDELRINYTKLLYYKNNSVIIPPDFYELIYNKTVYYNNTLNLEESYENDTIINYKINMLKLFFNGFQNETIHDKCLNYILNIFRTIIEINNLRNRHSHHHR